jgi:DNA-binding beta-propeller fold protein YncE
MRLFLATCGMAIALIASAAVAEPSAQTGPYKLLKTVKVGGDGGFDYVYADVAGRRLYIPRGGATPRVSVFDLDTLAPAGEIAGANARGAAVDPEAGHGFASSKPVAMWDAKTLAPIRTIDVQGRPDGIMDDPASQRIYVFSHAAPNATVINAVDGSVAGVIDLGGAPEQAVTDGKGHLYVDLEDKDQVALVDARTMTKTGVYGLEGKCGGPAGLAFDVARHILFVGCRDPQVMAMLDSRTGKILAVLPIGRGCDGVAFNPDTREAFSSQGDGTLTVVKEASATSFVVEQTVQTQPGAKTLSLDRKTGRILLIAAEYGPPPPPPAPAPGAPAPAPPARPGRGPMLPNSFAILVVGR